MGLTVGLGLIVIVKLLVAPKQVTPPFVYAGVTVMVAIKGAEPLLTAVNELMLPAPDAPIPIEGVSLVQLKTVPATVPENVTADVLVPLQSN